MSSGPADTLLLAEILESRARTAGDSEAFSMLDAAGTVTARRTFADLDRIARAVASSLEESQVVPGDRVLLTFPPGLDFVASLFGCFYAGVVAVPTFPPNLVRRTAETIRFDSVVRSAEPTAVLTTTSFRDPLSQHCHDLDTRREHLECIASDALDLSVASTWKKRSVDPNAVALLQYTSGSTGSPKGVMLSQRAMVSNLTYLAHSFEMTAGSRITAWIPMYHDMGLFGVFLQAIFVGCHATWFAPVDFLRRPLCWLEALTSDQATFSGAPNFAYDLCVDRISTEERDRLDLSSLSVMVNGSEPVSERTIKRFSKFFAPCGFRPEAMHPAFGLAEATLMVTASKVLEAPVCKTVDRTLLAEGRLKCVSDATPESKQTTTVVSSGSVPPEHTVLIIDPSTGDLLEDGLVGEVWVAGSSVALGYWNNAEDTDEVFENYVPGRDARFLRTGDFGSLIDGELFITGRMKDLIIIRGRNHWPNDLEETAQRASSDIQPGSCAAFNSRTDEGVERLVLACEIRREERRVFDGEKLSAILRAAIAAEHDVLVTTIVVLSPGRIPKTTSGKIRRRACRESFDAGELKALHVDEVADLLSPVSDENDRRPTVRRVVSRTQPPSREEIQAAEQPKREELVFTYVKGLICERLGIAGPMITSESTLGMLGFDSIRRTELSLQLEVDCAVSIEPQEFHAELTIADLTALVLEPMCEDVAPQLFTDIPIETGCEIPLNPAQHVFLSSVRAHPEKFVLVAYYRVPETLSPVNLEKAMRSVVSRHDAFRLRIRKEGDEWHQFYDDEVRLLDFEWRDVADIEPQSFPAMRLAIEEEWLSAFDLEKGPLAKGLVLDRGPMGTRVLLLAFHHLIFDGFSLAIFMLELELECAWICGEESNLMPRPQLTTFDWVAGMKQAAESEAVEHQLEYWEGHELCSPPRPVERTATEKTALSADLDPATSDAFIKCFAEGQEQHDVLLAAYLCAWQECMGATHCRVQLRHNGRSRLGSLNPNRLIGWLARDYPIAVDLQAGSAPQSQLQRVKEIVAEIPDHGRSFSLLRAYGKNPEVRARIAALSYFDLHFIYLGHMEDIGGLRGYFPYLGTRVLHGYEQRELSVKPKLSIVPKGGRLRVGLLYSPEDIRTSVAEQFIQRGLVHLRALIQE